MLNVPTALASASQAAEAVAETVRRDRQTGAQRKPVFAVWLGEDEVSKRAFEELGLPHFATEADAVRGFMHLVRYREAQDLMMETRARQNHSRLPPIATTISSRCHCELGRGRRARSRRANCGPNFRTHHLIVS